MTTRNQNLDILRGVAILLVLGAHCDYFRVWWSIGWCGVDLFFVLSGFLISGLLFAEYQRHGTIDVRRFWLRRGLKIWPPFYVFIGCSVVLDLTRHRQVSIALLHDSLFMGNYLSHFWFHTWSLAVEEHFYLALPIVLAALVKISRSKADPFRAVPMISILVIVLCLYLRARALEAGVGPGPIHWRTHLRMDSLFAGVALGYYYHFRPGSLASVRRRWLWFLGSVCLIPVVRDSLRLQFTILTYTFAFAAAACVLTAVVDRPPSTRLVPRSIAYVGSYSYSIYLWHAAIDSLVFKTFKPTFALFWLYVASSVALGVLMSKLIERPSLALRDHWLPARGKPAVLHTATNPVGVTNQGCEGTLMSPKGNAVEGIRGTIQTRAAMPTTICPRISSLLRENGQPEVAVGMLKVRVRYGPWERVKFNPFERKAMKNLLMRLWKEEEGQDLTEYALLLVLIALAAILSMQTLAKAINNAFSIAASNLTVNS